MGKKWGDERILGDSDFVRHVLLEADDKLTGKERHKQSGWSLGLLLETISEIFRIDSSSIQEKKRDSATSKARSLFRWWATNDLCLILSLEYPPLPRSKPGAAPVKPTVLRSPGRSRSHQVRYRHSQPVRTDLHHLRNTTGSLLLSPRGWKRV